MSATVIPIWAIPDDQTQQYDVHEDDAMREVDCVSPVRLISTLKYRCRCLCHEEKYLSPHEIHTHIDQGQHPASVRCDNSNNTSQADTNYLFPFVTVC